MLELWIPMGKSQECVYPSQQSSRSQALSLETGQVATISRLIYLCGALATDIECPAPLTFDLI